jgi:hypothetical protein
MNGLGAYRSGDWEEGQYQRLAVSGTPHSPETLPVGMCRPHNAISTE